MISLALALAAASAPLPVFHDMSEVVGSYAHTAGRCYGYLSDDERVDAVHFIGNQSGSEQLMESYYAGIQERGLTRETCRSLLLYENALIRQSVANK